MYFEEVLGVMEILNTHRKSNFFEINPGKEFKFAAEVDGEVVAIGVQGYGNIKNIRSGGKNIISNKNYLRFLCKKKDIFIIEVLKTQELPLRVVLIEISKN